MTFRCTSMNIATPPDEPTQRVSIQFADSQGAGSVNLTLPRDQAEQYRLGDGYTVTIEQETTR